MCRGAARQPVLVVTVIDPLERKVIIEAENSKMEQKNTWTVWGLNPCPPQRVRGFDPRSVQEIDVTANEARYHCANCPTFPEIMLKHISKVYFGTRNTRLYKLLWSYVLKPAQEVNCHHDFCT